MYKEYRLEDVLVTDTYIVNAFEKELMYLKSIDIDRLLSGFYENAGLKPKKIRYGGWEDSLIGGHTMGHFLNAIAQALVNPGVSQNDRSILNNTLEKVLEELRKCQENSKGERGYIFGSTVLDKNNVELQFDNVELGKTNIETEAWVPWYTMHKLLDGLVNVYGLTYKRKALILAAELGDWVWNRASKWSEEVHLRVLETEYGGMNEALYELYKFTRKKEHLEAAHLFDEVELFERVLAGERDVLCDVHANTTIPKFLGALNRYQMLGDSERKYLEFAISFWDMVVEKHTYVTGGNSEWEHFGKDSVLDAERTAFNNETCNTHNMLKLSRKLFMITGDMKYAEYFENTFINAILSSQNSEDGMAMYFQPMSTGFFKVFSTPYDSFWCCTGTGMENFTKLGGGIYFRNDDGIVVNGYISSTLYDEKRGIRLVQESDILEGGGAYFRVDVEQDIAFKLKLRIPEWTTSWSVKINGAAATDEYLKENDGYIEIEKLWINGEEIELELGMKITAVGLPDSENVYAFKYGPVLLSANLGFDDLVETTTGVNVTVPKNKIVENETLMIENQSVEEFLSNIDEHFEKDQNKMNFTLRGVKQPLNFAPHYKKNRERYGIYWYLDR
ncbi:MAG: glycoside hydrolase family 127 protein [Eubacterium sp.]|nr:glycoside hydrolase family 127 protein [Eubacterium sp.]